MNKYIKERKRTCPNIKFELHNIGTDKDEAKQRNSSPIKRLVQMARQNSPRKNPKEINGSMRQIIKNNEYLNSDIFKNNRTFTREKEVLTGGSQVIGGSFIFDKRFSKNSNNQNHLSKKRNSIHQLQQILQRKKQSFHKVKNSFSRKVKKRTDNIPLNRKKVQRSQNVQEQPLTSRRNSKNPKSKRQSVTADFRPFPINKALVSKLQRALNDSSKVWFVF